jgi:hypothetical protein
MLEQEIDPLASQEREKAESEAHEWQALREMTLATQRGQSLGAEWVNKEIEKCKVIANTDWLLEFCLFDSRDQYITYLQGNVLAVLESENEQS